MERSREGSRGWSLGRATTLLACTCIILLPAIINGFPFVYSDTGTYIIVYRVVLGLSVLAMAWSLWSNRRNAQGMEARIFIRYAATAIVIGAWTCATLSTAIPRYLGRDSWLLPLAVTMAIAAHPKLFALRRSRTEP